jgi:PBP1b-binding outer membrane lipoprotein LpoB
MHKQSKSLAALVFATVLLQGCNQQVDPAKVQADVTKAEAAGQKNIIDAQAKLDQVVAQNNKDLAGVQADAQKDAANNPNAPAPAASDNIAKARANGEIKVADAQFDVDKAKAGAVELVAEARCGAQVGDANKTCVSNAKASYDSAVAAAKAKNDAEHAAVGSSGTRPASVAPSEVPWATSRPLNKATGDFHAHICSTDSWRPRRCSNRLHERR